MLAAVPSFRWRIGDIVLRLRDTVLLDDVAGNNNLSRTRGFGV